MAARPAIRFKAEDIWDTPEDGNRYEVVDGNLYMTPPPIPEHQSGSGMLHVFVGHYVHAHSLGRVFSAPIGLVLDDENGLQPDLIYVSNAHLSIIGPKAIEGPPDLVVEVLSPSTRSRDYGIKMRRYAAGGVPNYWILDPLARTVEDYRLGERGYVLQGTYGPGRVFRPELFPVLEIPVDQLWM
ncbi:MAG: hypothetical protein HW416_2052 [Chloroflexi bacterium]|nr:hypothetical protein [Chloroflexota bacterium]